MKQMYDNLKKDIVTDLILLLFMLPLFYITTAKAQTGNPLPSPWSNTNIGDISLGGAAAYDQGSFIIHGAGNDIWGKADKFHFVYQTITGDGTIIVRIDSISYSNDWAKAGIMIRETLDQGSRHAMVAVTPKQGIVFHSRYVTNGLTAQHKEDGNAPCWLKLVRSGNVFTGFVSYNGSDWEKVGMIAVGMNKNVMVGMAVNSQNNTSTCRSVFSRVSVSTSLQAPSDLTGTATDSQTISLSWTNNQPSSKGTTINYQIERSLFPDSAFAEIATADTTTHQDSGLNPGTTYYYRVKAYNTEHESGFSNIISVQTKEISNVLTPPTNLTAVASSSTSITLHWTDNSGIELGFRIERSTGPDLAFSLIAEVSANTTSYVSPNLAAETTYYYRVMSYKLNEYSDYSNIAEANTGNVVLSTTEKMAEQALIEKAYPNPFTEQVTFDISQKATQQATVAVYSLSGELIKTLKPNEKDENKHSYRWNGKGNNGHPVPPGTYFTKIKAGNQSSVIRIIKR